MADTLVIVVGYGNPHLTEVAVDSLCGQTEDVDVVVWSNPDGQTDLRERLNDLASDSVTVHHSPENVLWTPAINAGIKEYSTSHLFVGWMNNDIYLPPTAIECMKETLQDPLVGLTAPYGASLGGPQDFASSEGAWTDLAPSWAELQEALRPRKPARVTYLMGALGLTRKSVWDEVGEFDEDMPLGADDHDYCIRLKRAGYQIWLTRSCHVEHIGHASGASGNWNSWGEKSWAHFNEKWAGYYATEEEALKNHWQGYYTKGYDR